MSFKEMDKEVRKIFDYYNRIMFKKYTLNEASDNDVEFQKIVFALGSLEDNNRFLITKEYIEHSPRNWWMLYYSKSTYYRIKNKAMTELLTHLKW